MESKTLSDILNSTPDENSIIKLKKKDFDLAKKYLKKLLLIFDNYEKPSSSHEAHKNHDETGFSISADPLTNPTEFFNENDSKIEINGFNAIESEVETDLKNKILEATANLYQSDSNCSSDSSQPAKKRKVLSKYLPKNTKNPKKISYVWKYFKKLPGGETARCGLCSNILKCGGSTTSMRGHLERIHKNQLKTETLEASSFNSNFKSTSSQKLAKRRRDSSESSSDSSKSSYKKITKKRSNNKSKKTSYVWKYFIKQSGTESARCVLCKLIRKCVGGSTTSMRGHLERIHEIFDT